jgi:formate hydrogenlyase subunit 6/NADH:ubiquinone oxidoreductase subunit I
MFGFGLIKGLWVTFKNFIGPTFTVQYPDKRVGLFKAAKYYKQNPFSFLKSHPIDGLKSIVGQAVIKEYPDQFSRFRGQEFNWYEDRCTGCASCAKFCPLGIIEIETHPGKNNIHEGTSYDIDVFDIDIGRCMFCGICVEACPFDALHMGSGFEKATEKREELVIQVDELRSADKRPSTWFRPQIEKSSYQPRDKEMDDSHDVGRHEKPTKEELTERWVNER